MSCVQKKKPMRRMKQSLMENNPPVPSSSEEEIDESDVEKSLPTIQKSKPLKLKPEESSEEETEEEESEDEEEDKSKSDIPAIKKTPEPATPEASTEESGSDDDSVVDTKSPSASAFTIKPAAAAASKPASESKQKDSNIKSTPAKVTGKRALETELNGKDSKGKKSKGLSKEDEGEDTKKSGGGAIRWTEKDEIAILNGLIRYKSEKGPSFDLGLFADFVEGSIRSDVSKTQLNDKIKRLGKKFLTLLEKSENGKDLFKPHESAFFELSKKIWNSAGKFIMDENAVNNNTTSKKSNKKAEGKQIMPKEEIKTVVTADEPIKKVNIEEEEISVDFQGLDEILRFSDVSDEDSMKLFQKNMNLIESSKAREMNNKWKKLQVEEFKVYAKKMALKSELSNLMLGAMMN